MASYISFQPSDFFNTKLYTGNGSTQSITGVGFQPDLNWIKDNSTDRHNLTDAARGATYWIRSDQTAASTADANAMTALMQMDFQLAQQMRLIKMQLLLFLGTGKQVQLLDFLAEQ